MAKKSAVNSSMLGRIGADESGAIDHIKAVMARAPSLFAGETPSRSRNLARWRLMRRRAQLIGCCVGESGAAMAETSLRTPATFDDSTPVPGQTLAISPLWVYSQARAYSRSQGINLWGEGAIVSHALLAMLKGFVAYEAWPSTTENYRSYQDGVIPQSAVSAMKLKPSAEALRIDDFDQALEYIGVGGYTLWAGTPWRGSMSTRADGYFSWSGGSVGGHAYELMAYDKDQDKVWVGNSWDNASWGFQPGGIGWTKLSALAKEFTGKKLSSGSAEICLIAEISDGKPVVKPPSWEQFI
jgi:hypothetical protein